MKISGVNELDDWPSEDDSFVSICLRRPACACSFDSSRKTKDYPQKLSIVNYTSWIYHAQIAWKHWIEHNKNICMLAEKNTCYGKMKLWITHGNNLCPNFWPYWDMHVDIEYMTDSSSPPHTLVQTYNFSYQVGPKAETCIVIRLSSSSCCMRSSTVLSVGPVSSDILLTSCGNWEFLKNLACLLGGVRVLPCFGVWILWGVV